MGAIVGALVGCAVVLGAGGFLFVRQRRRRTAGGSSTNLAAAGSAAGESGGKLGRSFTIRKPNDAYILENDRDLNDGQYPKYLSDQDAQNVPYYEDNQKSMPLNYHHQFQPSSPTFQTQALQEYELNDTKQYKTTRDVSETQRMVEQEQRKMMNGYQQMSTEFESNQMPTLSETRNPRTQKSQQSSQGGYTDRF